MLLERAIDSKSSADVKLYDVLPKTRKRVEYFHHPEVGNYYYGSSHPMKPARMMVTHELVLAYGVQDQMTVHKPVPVSESELCTFHSKDYIDFLRRINPENMCNMPSQMQKYNVGFVGQYDCPVFEGILSFCQRNTAGSLRGATRLGHGFSDCVINWSGGLHHAKRSEASGFCYANDIVVGIIELLKFYPRVLYIDIDIHHGDGVEEAFWYTDRVMTASFHKYGDFFPGTGDVKDIGEKAGKNYSVNVPLHNGMTDEAYESIFVPVIQKIMEVYRPGAVVLQCGADSLNGDRLGVFNLTVRGHGKCVEFMRSYDVPLMILGGGGYRVNNVSRCWAYETAVCCGVELKDDLPYTTYWDYFAPDYKLHYPMKKVIENKNPKEYLHGILEDVFENLRTIQTAPNVQMQYLPPAGVDAGDMSDVDEEEAQQFLSKPLHRAEYANLD